jgi:hypothetical protein
VGRKTELYDYLGDVSRAAFFVCISVQRFLSFRVTRDMIHPAGVHHVPYLAMNLQKLKRNSEVTTVTRKQRVKSNGVGQEKIAIKTLGEIDGLLVEHIISGERPD